MPGISNTIVVNLGGSNNDNNNNKEDKSHPMADRPKSFVMKREAALRLEAMEKTGANICY